MALLQSILFINFITTCVLANSIMKNFDHEITTRNLNSSKLCLMGGMNPDPDNCNNYILCNQRQTGLHAAGIFHCPPNTVFSMPQFLCVYRSQVISTVENCPMIKSSVINTERAAFRLSAGFCDAQPNTGAYCDTTTNELVYCLLNLDTLVMEQFGAIINCNRDVMAPICCSAVTPQCTFQCLTTTTAAPTTTVTATVTTTAAPLPTCTNLLNIAHPTSCTSYYKCVFNSINLSITPQKLDCLPGYYFNTVVKFCMLGVCPYTTTAAPGTITTTVSSITTTVPSRCNYLFEKIPASTCGASFWICIPTAGLYTLSPYLVTCSSGFYFNTLYKMCSTTC